MVRILLSVMLGFCSTGLRSAMRCMFGLARLTVCIDDPSVVPLGSDRSTDAVFECARFRCSGFRPLLPLDPGRSRESRPVAPSPSSALVAGVGCRCAGGSRER